MRSIGILLFASVCIAANTDRLKPRPSVTDYPARAVLPPMEIGAKLLTPEEVRGAFVTGLDKDFLVIEVGLYPGATKLDVDRDDFLLRVAGKDILRPADYKALATAVQNANTASPSDVTIYPTVGVGYGTGPGGYGRGTSTSVGVGVGIGGAGGPRPASTDRDRKTMETELSDKSLPEGPAAQPVAGYLYFPLPKKHRGVLYELEYVGDGDRARLNLGTWGGDAKSR